MQELVVNMYDQALRALRGPASPVRMSTLLPLWLKGQPGRFFIRGGSTSPMEEEQVTEMPEEEADEATC